MATAVVTPVHIRVRGIGDEAEAIDVKDLRQFRLFLAIKVNGVCWAYCFDSGLGPNFVARLTASSAALR